MVFEMAINEIMLCQPHGSIREENVSRRHTATDNTAFGMLGAKCSDAPCRYQESPSWAFLLQRQAHLARIDYVKN